LTPVFHPEECPELTGQESALWGREAVRMAFSRRSGDVLGVLAPVFAFRPVRTIRFQVVRRREKSRFQRENGGFLRFGANFSRGYHQSFSGLLGVSTNRTFAFVKKRLVLLIKVAVEFFPGGCGSRRQATGT
jgi:hypothetical protein